MRDPDAQAEAIFQVLQVAQQLGWQYCGLTWSPLQGPAGNIEYLLWLAMDSFNPPVGIDAIRQITIAAQRHYANA